MGINYELENSIYWCNGEKTVEVTFSSSKFINKIKKIHEDHPEEFVKYHENADGSIFARVPTKWIKFSYPRQMSDEQRAAASERLRKVRGDATSASTE